LNQSVNRRESLIVTPEVVEPTEEELAEQKEQAMNIGMNITNQFGSLISK